MKAVSLIRCLIKVRAAATSGRAHSEDLIVRLARLIVLADDLDRDRDMDMAAVQLGSLRRCALIACGTDPQLVEVLTRHFRHARCTELQQEFALTEQEIRTWVVERFSTNTDLGAALSAALSGAFRFTFLSAGRLDQDLWSTWIPGADGAAQAALTRVRGLVDALTLCHSARRKANVGAGRRP